MSEAHYSCRYCGTELHKVRIGEYWAYVCPSTACKDAHYPTTPKETGDGKE
jgi:NADH pyrophosphatase NudC (nudix superfamily)